MIGKLKGRSGWTAELQDDGSWKASDEMMQLVLDGRFRAREDSSPASGVFGRNTLLRAAESLNAEVELSPDKSAPLDAHVY